MLGDKPGWGVKVRVWVERDGLKVLGPGRMELLEHIDREQSISAAARKIAMSYRRAWSLVQSMNENAGEPLVEAVTGGTGGGGARLTDRGREAVALYRGLLRRIHRAAEPSPVPKRKAR
jgi:molybdate transport system regulatory protein